MHSIGPFELGDQATLVDLAKPQHLAQANVVEPVTADGFIVRRLHASGETPVPYQLDRVLVVVVGVCAEPQPRLSAVVVVSKAEGALGSHLTPRSMAATCSPTHADCPLWSDLAGRRSVGGL